MFEAAILCPSGLAEVIASTPQGDLRRLIIAKLFRVRNDFFNFLEDSPRSLALNEFVRLLLSTANNLSKEGDEDTVIEIFKKIILEGEAAMLVESAISGG